MLNHFWWGAVFLINAPVIAAFLCLAPILLKEVRGSRPGRIDIPSVALSAGGIFLFVYGVQSAAAQGMGRLNASLIFSGSAVLAVFIRRQVRLETPLLDVGLFKGRVFTVAILTGLFSLLVWSAIAYLSMTYLQSVLGYTVLHAALLAVPGAVVLTLSCVLTPVLVERTGARAALILCHFSVAAGMLPLILTDETTGPMLYVASTMITGVGFGISFSLVADTAVGAVPESRAGAAGAIAETSNEVGNALGIALLGSLMTVVFRASYPGPETGIGEVIDGPGIGSTAFESARSAFLNGFHVVAAVAALICIALGVLAARWIPRRAPGL